MLPRLIGPWFTPGCLSTSSTPFHRIAFGLLLWLALLVGRPAQAQVAGAIEVYPTTSSLENGTSRQFTAYVPISPNTVVWTVNDLVGGNATLGTISTTGLYQAPPVAPLANPVIIRARSTAYPGSVGAATLTLTRPYPWLWSASPSTLKVGSYQVSFNGRNFAPDSVALADGMPVNTTYVSSTTLVVKGIAAQAGTLKFSVRQPAPGAVTGNTVNAKVQAVAVSVALTPTSATVTAGTSRTFTATVTGTANPAVTWSVNGVNGGNATVGTITTGGTYTAPATVPSPATVSVRASSVASPTVLATASVTLSAPLPSVSVAVTPATAEVQLGASRTFTATVTVTGSANSAVTWSVNNVTGGNATVGTITSAGTYTAPATVPSPANVTLRATSVANPTVSATAAVTVKPIPVPPVAPTWLAGARFLEQSSFGPNSASLSRVQLLGIQAYLDEQFALPATPIPTPANNSMGELQRWLLHSHTVAPDQLRQRVAYSLSQIVVTSGNKLVYANEIVPWMRILQQQAFGNYRDLLRDVTRSPSMGKFLDLANSQKPGLAGGANENYPREMLQLFTLGLWQLNPDGSQKLDVGGAPIPAYTQDTVAQVARTLTGWTYATAPGATPNNLNWEYFGAPMESRPQNHDASAKLILGVTVPAGQTVEQDLESLLDILMQHPNLAPFISTRLIRSLVLSNPSPGYIQRVSAVFANNGQGVRGDLKAVVRAILLDPEARNDVAQPNSGRLKEPILQICGFLRALDGRFNSTHQLTYLFDNLAQLPLAPPSVFSWYSPMYRVPKQPTLFGPEFQIYSPTEASLRGNFLYTILNQPGGDLTIDLTPYQPYGNDLPGLVELVNQRLLHGRMPAAMKPVLIAAATPGYDARTRIETVLYLTALSGQYAVQY